MDRVIGIKSELEDKENKEANAEEAKLRQMREDRRVGTTDWVGTQSWVRIADAFADL
jgi:hypothetical protein